VLVLAAVAAALYPATDLRSASGAGGIHDGRRRHPARAVEGSARIGAGVGGVILVSAGAAVATVMLLPGALTRRRA